MTEWYLDAAFKEQADAEAFVFELEGWEFKVEEIGGVEGAYWGVYRRKTDE